jgi:hypothetical protein
MLGIAHHPSTPIVSKGSLCLGAVVLALFGVLVFSATARADGPGSVSEALTPTETPEGAVPVPPEAPQTPVPVVPPPEVLPPVPNPEVGPESAPALPPPEAVPAGPTPEPAGEPVPAVPAPEPGPGPVPATPAPEAAPPGPGPEATPEALPVGAGREPASEAAAAGAGKEGAAEGSVAPVAGAPQDGAGPSHGAVEVSTGTAGLPTSAPTGGTGEAAAASAPARASGGVKGIVVSRPAGDLTCELSALQGRVGPNCGGGLIGSQHFFSTSPIGFVAGAAGSLAADGPSGPPPDGGHGGSAVLRLPVSPAPGPAPSGVSGGSATGATGLALSGPLTLSAQLLLAAPRALRRLRLSSTPWRTACFVLIPERPG